VLARFTRRVRFAGLKPQAVTDAFLRTASDLRVDIGRRLTDGPRWFSGRGPSDGPVRRKTVRSEWAGAVCRCT